MDREEILQRAYENLARIDAELAEPRPVMTYEPPRQIKTHDADRIELNLIVG